MASKPSPSTEKYTDDIDVIDIYQMLRKLPMNKSQSSHGVCISHVPKSMSSVKPEAFSPQFVGLGPYHHSDPNLTMTNELKLSVVRRAFEGYLPGEEDVLKTRIEKFVIDIEPFYHADVITKYDHRTLLKLFTVDGLFLLALLRRNNDILRGQYSSYYLLTGKPFGMPLVNAADEELTMDGIRRDVFMLENQIPTFVLKQICMIRFASFEMGLIMRTFCEELCPLVHPQELSIEPDAHDHLLDLMYHLIVPPMEPEPEPELESQSDHLNRFRFREIPTFLIFSCLIFFCGSVYFLKLIQHLFLSLLRLIRKTFQLLLGKNMPSFRHTLSRGIEILYNVLSPFATKHPSLRPYLQIIGEIKDRRLREFLQRHSTDSDRVPPSDAKFELPSATKLHKAGIQFEFQRGEVGISSIRFDEPNSKFYLPRIRLDVISEVIIRNLMAYESLAKSNYLIFTRYIELMCALINTSEDVKLLKRVEIIQTQLSDQVVAQLFNEMSESIGHTKIPRMEEVIKEVKAKFDGIQNLNWFRTEYVYPNLIFSAAIMVIVILGLMLPRFS